MWSRSRASGTLNAKILSGEWLTLMLLLSSFSLFRETPLCGQELVRVDIPALVAGQELDSPFGDEATGPETTPPSALEKRIQFNLPVSVWLDPKIKDSFYAVEYRISWNRSLYPLVDYWPKSSLQSPVDGVVLTERHTERRLSGGVATDGFLQTFAAVANASGELEEQVSRRYAVIPERAPLIESGPAARSTGAFFRFHDSRQVVIEGGRQLQLLYRVPSTWRAGLMVVEARVYLKGPLGEEPRLGYQRQFTLPVHQADDASARLQAIAYVQAETQLRDIWDRGAARTRGARLGESLARWSGKGPAVQLEQLLSDPSVEPLRLASERLDSRIQAATEQLLSCRAELLGLSR